MISTNSLAAFTQEVSRSAGLEAVRPTSPVQRAAALDAPQQRSLGSVPPPPSGQTPPRGSLLDLRV